MRKPIVEIILLSILPSLFLLGCGGGGGSKKETSQQDVEVSKRLNNIFNNDENYSKKFFSKKDRETKLATKITRDDVRMAVAHLAQRSQEEASSTTESKQATWLKDEYIELIPDNNEGTLEIRILVPNLFKQSFILYGFASQIKVLLTTPKNGAKMASTTNMKVVFNKEVTQESVKSGIVLEAKGGEDSPVEIEVTLSSDSNKVATINHKTAMKNNTEYTLNISSSIEDKNGNNLGENKKISFTTSTTFTKDSNEFGHFASSVSIYGNYLIVGSKVKNKYKGRVYIYKIDKKSGNDFIINKNNPIILEANDNKSQRGYPYFGRSVSMYKNYLVVGAENDSTNNKNAGKVYIYKINTDIDITDTSKTQEHRNKFIANRDNPITFSTNVISSKFGTSVSMYENYLVVGAAGSKEDKGEIYIYKIDKNIDITDKSKTQKQRNEFIINRDNPVTLTGSNISDYFGYSVSMYENYLVVGKNGDRNFKNQEIVYIYKINTDINIADKSKTQKQRNEFIINRDNPVTLIDRYKDNNFARSVSIYENYLIVGSITLLNKKGKIYIYKIDKNIDITDKSKTQKQRNEFIINRDNPVTLKASDAQRFDWFGRAVYMYGDYLVAGAMKKAYIYDLALDTLPQAITYEANTTSGLISYLKPPLNVSILYAVSNNENIADFESLHFQESKPALQAGQYVWIRYKLKDSTLTKPFAIKVKNTSLN